MEDNIPNSVLIRPDFDCGSPTCNYRTVECKLTTTDELNRNKGKINKNNTQTEPSSVSIAIPDEGKG